MSQFLRSIHTRGGKRDKMFGFSFNNASAIYQTRGDRLARRREFTEHLLAERVFLLKRFLSGRRAGRISARAG